MADRVCWVLTATGAVVGFGLTPAPRIVVAVLRADDDARVWMAKGVLAARSSVRARVVRAWGGYWMPVSIHRTRPRT